MLQALTRRRVAADKHLAAGCPAAAQLSGGLPKQLGDMASGLGEAPSAVRVVFDLRLRWSFESAGLDKLAHDMLTGGPCTMAHINTAFLG